MACILINILSITINKIKQVNLENQYFYNYLYSAQGEEQFNAVTQFEPTFARRVFPCWDEPALRATFDIELIVPKSHVALSNMVNK